MTQECYETHMLHLQCKYADLTDKYLNQLSVGADCKNLEKDVLIVKSILRLLNNYDYTETCNCDSMNEENFCKLFNYTDAILCKYNCKC